METFQEYREQGLRHIGIADHMLAVTYPLVKDPKLLTTILDNIYESMIANVTSLLAYEYTFKRINPFSDHVEEKLRLFNHLSQKHQLPNKYVHAIQELRELIHEHKKSPMEFSKKDTLVIYTDEQDIKTLSIEIIQKYLQKAKEFHTAIEKLTVKDEGIFR